MTPSGLTIAIGCVLFANMAAYALFAGADFGGGIWDLLAGGDRRGSAPRTAIDASLTPVWEGNQVWIVLGLVVFWTGFPPAFAAVMTALFVPLAASVLAIVLRGVGFAFRHEAKRLSMQRLSGALFAASSLMAPFFLGTCVGAVATGAVSAYPAGNDLGAWTSPTAIVTGLLFLAACAYISAIYLIGDARRRAEPEMVRYFSLRALVSGAVTGLLAGVNLWLLYGSARYVFDRILGPALPAVVVSVVAGIAALALIVLRRTFLLRPAGALAVVSVVAGWGVAQYPWLLPGHLSLTAGSAPPSALRAELAVVGLAVLIVVPSFVWLYWLQQHGKLVEGESSEALRAAVAADNRSAQVVEGASPLHGDTPRVVVAAVLTSAVVELIRDAASRRRHRHPEDPG